MGKYADKWQLASDERPDEIQGLLDRGWEPFAIEPRKKDTPIFYFRRPTGVAVRISDE
jgi:hypothetical protein